MANLLAPAHVGLAGRYAALVTPGGALVLGGIEAKEASDVVAAVTGRGFTVPERRTIAGWSTLLCRR